PLAEQLLGRIVVGPRAFVPAAPEDPLALRQAPREGGHALDGLRLGGDADQIDLALSLAQAGDVRVRVDEAGQDRRPAEIDDARLRPAPGPGVAVRAYEDDAIAADRHRLGVGVEAARRARRARGGRAVG